MKQVTCDVPYLGVHTHQINKINKDETYVAPARKNEVHILPALHHQLQNNWFQRITLYKTALDLSCRELRSLQVLDSPHQPWHKFSDLLSGSFSIYHEFVALGSKRFRYFSNTTVSCDHCCFGWIYFLERIQSRVIFDFRLTNAGQQVYMHKGA